jgi:hypothetical protein
MDYDLQENIIRNLDKKHQCARCNQIYFGYNNVGSLNCKQHMCEYNVNGAGQNYPVGRYDCCGVSKDLFSPYYHPNTVVGCTPCDHCVYNPEKRFTVADDLVFEWDALPPNIGLYSRSAFITDDGKHVVVKRYDVRIARKRMQYGRYYPDEDTEAKDPEIVATVQAACRGKDNNNNAYVPFFKLKNKSLFLTYPVIDTIYLSSLSKAVLSIGCSFIVR